MICLMSELLFRELPSHYHSNLDDVADMSDAASSLNYREDESYRVYRELHSPEHLYADAFLMFEKILDLGIKDLYYIGETPTMPDFFAY